MQTAVIEAGPGHLRDIAWLVRSLDALTYAGQRHEIAKIVGLLEDEVGRSWQGADRRVEAFLATLRREMTRLRPDISAFAASAEALMGLLGSRS